MSRKYKKRVIIRETLYDYFVKRLKFHDSDSCLEWDHSCSSGYGCVTVKNCCYREGTHRLAWKLTYGEIPNGLQVLHKCDNKKCYNPNHLFLGTQKDNMDDKRNKGRLLFGEAHQNSKLTEDKVKQIRHLTNIGWSTGDVAQLMELQPQHVFKVATGKLWPHV